MQDNTIANPMVPYLQLQMYAKFTQLDTCANMEQGFPNFRPPQFLRQAIKVEALTESLQYTQTAGHLRLLKAASDFYEKHMGIKVDTAKRQLQVLGQNQFQHVFSRLSLIQTMKSYILTVLLVLIVEISKDFYRPLIELQGLSSIKIQSIKQQAQFIEQI
ncbi:unnamed protein product (macronuclear) [Paramecium tetraurelia]|uniref:Uncharacterized protein n=1 Tax=Paramecium tetraurelia TaxID=5888 RepID=A0DUI1_PARTE|nr:uncharacterized protein GSPATT00020370001 [Paramecium tetraurelia]CAK86698.1 unnamed protein product [Paramecium tetraurelia]|eukprot:XP_001454095.1 hypothetical protein (macronuclear) [Paramecium tetraurelia strain d4-2]